MIKKIKKKINKKKKNLCYGSIFKCLEKEYDRYIIIKSKDISFILIRVYFHRVSAIEIFTINKSYYFNFKNHFEVNNFKKNKILTGIKSIAFFKEIKIRNKDKFTLGFYNPLFESYLFPLFKDDKLNNWDTKIKYLRNYDILILINIFSNRSFKDVYQYPVFPTLYKWIKLERDLKNHIGFQEISDKSKTRKKKIIESRILCQEDEHFDDQNNDIILYTIHYSNPIYVFNYLLRVLPYSFLAIEFNGDNFDAANRLFYSIKVTLENTLNLKSDLREMIPELFYMMELFYNKNKILFQQLKDGTNIDNVMISQNEDIIPQTHKERIYKMSLFLYQMRKNLEDNKNLHDWIDLIFGSKQLGCVYENNKYKYYEELSETYFKNDINILGDSLKMNYSDFGLIPYQLFNKDFPVKEKLEANKMEALKKFNLELFNNSYYDQIKSPFESFICFGTTIINESYIKIIDPNIQINNLDIFGIPPKIIQKTDTIINLNICVIEKLFENINSFSNNIKESLNLNDKGEKHNFLSSLINYYFVGDIFGSVYIFSLVKYKKNKYDEKEEKDNSEVSSSIKGKKGNNVESYFNKVNKKTNPIHVFYISQKYPISLRLILKLNDHSKEIKYIDFNQRLNILLTYSLDNYINIYIVPQFKLINVINVESFKEKEDLNIFQKIVSISYPFPMIVCYNKEYIYLLSINGELIKYEKLDKNHKILFYVDKNLGLINDSIEVSDEKGIYEFNYIYEKS